MMRVGCGFVIGCLVQVLVGCGGDAEGGDDDGAVDPEAAETVVEIPATPNPDLDVLFVVDNSVGMASKQRSVATALPRFLARLRLASGGLPNLHIGVVSTDMGTTGSGSRTAGAPIGTLGTGGCADDGDAEGLLTHGAAVTGSFVADIA